MIHFDVVGVCERSLGQRSIFRCQDDLTMLCLTSAVQCVFSAACDLYSMFWRGTCEEALLK